MDHTFLLWKHDATHRLPFLTLGDNDNLEGNPQGWDYIIARFKQILGA